MDAPVPSPAAAPPPRKPAGADHRLEDLLFPPLQGWKRSVALFFYYLVIILALMLIYGRGDFTTAPFITRASEPERFPIDAAPPATHLFERLQRWADEFPDRPGARCRFSWEHPDAGADQSGTLGAGSGGRRASPQPRA